MDQAVLVREQIDGGEKLISHLLTGGLPVIAAFWAKTDGDGQWYLYVVTPEVDVLGTLGAYRRLGELEKTMNGVKMHPLERIDRFGIKVISPKQPLALAALDLYHRFPEQTQTFLSFWLGSVAIEGAYIYPPALFEPQPQTG